MKRYEFTDELSNEAYAVYSDSSFTFYKEDETFFCADNPQDKPYEIGTLADVEDYLLQFYEEEEE